MKREHRISLPQEGIGRQEAARNDLLGLFSELKTPKPAENTQSFIGNTVVGTAERMQHAATGEITKSTELAPETLRQPSVLVSDEVRVYSEKEAIRKAVANGAGIVGMRDAQMNSSGQTMPPVYTAETPLPTEYTNAA